MLGLLGDKELISLDWDSRLLRAVEWQINKSGAKVRRCVVEPVPPQLDIRSAAVMAVFIRQVLDRARMRASATVIDVPRDQAVLNAMSLPAVSVNDLAGMVNLQLAKELPFPAAEAVVDFAVTEVHEQNRTADVLVAAIRREVLNFLQEVCQRAGLKLERVGLRPYANMVAIKQMLGGRSSGRVMFVDVGPTLTEIGILRDGALVFSRAASVHLDDYREVAGPAGGSDAGMMEIEITPANSLPALRKSDPEQKAIDTLLVEITRSAEAYRSTDPGARFDQIVVAGSSGLERRLLEGISKRFLVQAQRYSPGSIMRQSTLSEDQQSALAAAIGLGLGQAHDHDLHFDFMHPKRVLDAAERRKKWLPYIGAAAGVLILLGAAAWWVGIRPYRQQIALVEKDIQRLEGDLQRLSEAATVVQKVQRWQAEQLVWPDELVQLLSVLPDARKAHLQDLTLAGAKGEISFELVASDHAVIYQLVDAIKKLSHPGEKEGEAQLLFNVVHTQISNNEKDEKYPSRTRVTVASRRIAELEEKENRRSRS
ncbi:MAG: hypothetical protein HJJLKODD_00520 [Phycisphaerae bacterium]|nr:hypothetical protein [Phycisphaerae bacterium]